MREMKVETNAPVKKCELWEQKERNCVWFCLSSASTQQRTAAEMMSPGLDDHLISPPWTVSHINSTPLTALWARESYIYFQATSAERSLFTVDWIDVSELFMSSDWGCHCLGLPNPPNASFFFLFFSRTASFQGNRSHCHVWQLLRSVPQAAPGPRRPDHSLRLLMTGGGEERDECWINNLVTCWRRPRISAEST